MALLRPLSWCSLAVLSLLLVFPQTVLSQSDNAQPSQQTPSQNAAPGQTQQTPPAATAPERVPLPTVTIHTTVRRVIEDVMVRGADGKPVHGLKSSDFSVWEDKQPQRILSFDVYDFEKPSISLGPNARPLPPNTLVNIPKSPEHGPLYVMLYDLVNTEIEDQMTARGKILKFISGKPAGTRFAIFVNTDQLRLVQGFTDDKDLLYAALDPKHPRAHVPRIFLLGRNYGYGDAEGAMSVLTFIGRYLDGIPGRKNLIWVAGTFPTAVYPRESDPVQAQSNILDEMNALAHAEVAVFPVNVRGVVVYPEGRTTGAVPQVGGAAPTSPPGTPAPATTPVAGGALGSGSPVASAILTTSLSVNQGGASLSGDYTTQDALAAATGGRAFYSDNGLTEILEQATEDGGNYYTLTYSPPDQNENGKCHNIVVRVGNVKYQLSYRRSYCRVPLVSSEEDGSGQSETSKVALPVQAADELQANIREGAPMLHDLIFSAHFQAVGNATMATPEQMEHLAEQAAFFRTHRKNKEPKPLAPVQIQTYAIDYQVMDPELKVRAARSGRAPTLEFAVAAFDEDGKVMNGIVNDGILESQAAPGKNKAGIYRVRQALEVPVRAVSIRVGVRDRLTNRMGTVEVALPLAPEAVARATPR